MAELEMTRDSLLEAMKTKAPSGDILDMTYRLVEKEPLLRDVPTYPANQGAVHYMFRWVSEITAQIIAVGGGLTTSVVHGQQQTVGMFIAGSRYAVGESVLTHYGAGAAQYRREQERAHEVGITRGWTSTVLRGSAATSELKINGLANIAPYNVLTADQCVQLTSPGSSNLRRLWLICPGMSRFYFIYNKDNPTLGVKRTPEPKQLLDVTDFDVNGSGKAWYEFTDFEFEHGIAVEDTRAIKCIVNIDRTAAITDELIDKIVELRLIHSNYFDGQWFLLADPRMYIKLVSLANKVSNVQYSSDNPYRVSLPMIGDIIVRNIEALNYDDSVVSA